MLGAPQMLMSFSIDPPSSPLLLVVHQPMMTVKMPACVLAERDKVALMICISLLVVPRKPILLGSGSRESNGERHSRFQLQAESARARLSFSRPMYPLSQESYSIVAYRARLIYPTFLHPA